MNAEESEILGKMVKRAKDYVTKMRSNLTSYTDVAQLTEAIVFTESTITSCEDVIAKEARGTTRTSSSDPSLYATAIPSVTTPLTSTPAGEHSLSKSMIPISTYVGGPAHGDADPSDDDSGHDDEDHANKGTRERDHDNDEGSRESINMKRKKQVSQKSGPIVGSPKTPRIDPTYYFWNGKTASLRNYIGRWRQLLDPTNYSPASAVNFILSCIPRDKQHLVSDCTTAEEALQELNLYATEATTHPANIVEAMKSHRVCTTHEEDKIMIALFEKSFADITKLEGPYILNFLTAQQLCRKFSTIAMRTEYIRILLNFKDSTSDKHGINNYLPTMKQIIIKAKMDLMDIEQKDSNRNGQLHGNKDANKQKSRRGVLGGRTNGRPINQDEKEDLPFDLNPFALYP